MLTLRILHLCFTGRKRVNHLTACEAHQQRKSNGQLTQLENHYRKYLTLIQIKGEEAIPQAGKEGSARSWQYSEAPGEWTKGNIDLIFIKGRKEDPGSTDLSAPPVRVSREAAASCPDFSAF